MIEYNDLLEFSLYSNKEKKLTIKRYKDIRDRLNLSLKTLLNEKNELLVNRLSLFDYNKNLDIVKEQLSKINSLIETFSIYLDTSDENLKSLKANKQTLH